MLMGWGDTQQNAKSAKHFLNYVVASVKYRLPTWLLNTTKHYDSTHTNPLQIRDSIWNTKWFRQRPLVSRRQRGDKKVNVLYRRWVAVWCVLGCLQVGDEDGRSTWSACWRQNWCALCCCFPCWVGNHRGRVCISHLYSQLALILATLHRPFHALFIFTIFIYLLWLHWIHFTHNFFSFHNLHWKRTSFLPYSPILKRRQQTSLWST